MWTFVWQYTIYGWDTGSENRTCKHIARPIEIREWIKKSGRSNNKNIILKNKQYSMYISGKWYKATKRYAALES